MADPAIVPRLRRRRASRRSPGSRSGRRPPAAPGTGRCATDGRGGPSGSKGSSRPAPDHPHLARVLGHLLDGPERMDTRCRGERSPGAPDGLGPPERARGPENAEAVEAAACRRQRAEHVLDPLDVGRKIAGHRRGTEARHLGPVVSCDVGIVLAVGRAHHGGKDAAVPCAGDRVGQQRMPGQSLDVLVRYPLGSRAGGHEGDGGRGGHGHFTAGPRSVWTRMFFKLLYTSSASVPGSRLRCPTPHPAERHVRLAAVGPAVHHGHAGLDAVSELRRPVDAGRVDACGQPVGRAVGQRERRLEIRGAIERRHRTEQLGARDRRIGGCLEQRRRQVEAVPVTPDRSTARRRSESSRLRASPPRGGQNVVELAAR